MVRSFVIYGETMTRVKGRVGSPLSSVKDLGMTVDPIRITPRFMHRDVNVDDFGPETPADVLAMMADCIVRMNLVHYDEPLVRACVNESMGGTTLFDGVCGAAGRPLGGGTAIFSPTNRFISLGILPLIYILPWRFRATYLNAQPFEIPIGTEKSIVQLSWRALPYVLPSTGTSYNLSTGQQQAGSNRGEVVSSGAVIWDHQLDT